MRETRGRTSQANTATHSLVQCSIALLALVMITAASYRLHSNLATVSLLFVIVVVLLSRVGTLASSVVISIVAALLLAYIAPPAFSFRVDNLFDIVAVVAFLITSLIIARLVIRLRSMSEEARSSVNRKLIDAEERVRARIGRELHDDIEQRVALLAVKLTQMTREQSDPAHTAPTPMDGINEQAAAIAGDVQALAYELRPYKLEYLGVAAAMNGLCKRFSEQRTVKVDFTSYDLPTIVPVEAAHTLIRVLQEGLENAANHSGARHFKVELFGTLEAVHLTLHDAGIGFDVKAGMNTPGLGLVSMLERMKLIKGDLLIDSQPQRGTTLHAKVPLTSEINFETPHS